MVERITLADDLKDGGYRGMFYIHNDKKLDGNFMYKINAIERDPREGSQAALIAVEKYNLKNQRRIEGRDVDGYDRLCLISCLRDERVD